MITLLVGMLLGMWQSMVILASLTVASEWDRIPASSKDKLKYLVIFPLYMLTYIPITIQALFTKVTWKPIQHYSTAQLATQRKTLNF